VSAAGTVATSCSGNPANYDVTFVAGGFTVNKAVLTVTANAASRAYGAAEPSFGATVTGFVNGDTSSVVTGTPTFTSSDSATSVVGTYTITPVVTGLSAANYSFTAANGTLTITKAAITVTASSPSAITYGQSAPTVTGSVTAGSLVGTDTLTSINITCSAGSVSAAGTVATSCSGNPANYDVTFVAGGFTVNKAVLTVTANAASRAYGAAEPSFAATVTGFVNGDTSSVVTGTPTFTSTDSATSVVGTYTITPVVTGLSAANYSFTAANGTLTITKAAITVTASSPSAITYGQSAPTVTGSVTAGSLVGTDTLTSIGITCSAGSVSAAGTVATSCSGTPANYDVTFVAGGFTVNKAVLTVTANAASRAYGAAEPSFGATVTGFVNGDTSSVVTGTPTFTSTDSATSVVGTYTITPVVTGLSAANYSFTAANGTRTITKAAITVTA